MSYFQQTRSRKKTYLLLLSRTSMPAVFRRFISQHHSPWIIQFDNVNNSSRTECSFDGANIGGDLLVASYIIYVDSFLGSKRQWRFFAARARRKENKGSAAQARSCKNVAVDIRLVDIATGSAKLSVISHTMNRIH